MDKLILKRVPPGDQWTDVDGDSEVFPSLTDGLQYAYSKTKVTEFHLSTKKGEVYLILPDPEPEPEPIKTYDMYDEGY